MTALGELMSLIVYLILAVPILIVFFRMLFTKDKNKKISRLIYMLISTIPLILFIIYQYSNSKKVENRYIGTYNLTDYQDCIKCILTLNAKNLYYVTSYTDTVEKGHWRYRSGGDYWIVDIGEFGQLGAGQYKFNNDKLTDVKKTLKAGLRELQVEYILWGCSCPNWIMTVNRIHCEENNIPKIDSCFYLEPADSLNSIDYDEFDFDKEMILLKGQFYNEKGFPKGFDSWEEPTIREAKIFRYTEYKIINKN